MALSPRASLGAYEILSLLGQAVLPLNLLSILAVLGPEGSPPNGKNPLPHCAFSRADGEDPAP